MLNLLCHRNFDYRWYSADRAGGEGTMRLSIFAAGMLALAVPAVALAASQPIKVYPGFMNACPKQIGPPASPGVVCTQNVVVSGGVPHSGYTFKVKPGTTLPPGIFLMATTGVLTATTSNPLLP